MLAEHNRTGRPTCNTVCDRPHIFIDETEEQEFGGHAVGGSHSHVRYSISFKALDRPAEAFHGASGRSRA